MESANEKVLTEVIETAGRDVELKGHWDVHYHAWQSFNVLATETHQNRTHSVERAQ